MKTNGYNDYKHSEASFALSTLNDETIPFCNLVQICLGTLRNFSLGLLDSKCTKVHNNELKFTVQSIRYPGRVETWLSASTTRPWPADISANSALSLRQSALKSNKKTYHGIAEIFYDNLLSM